MHRSTLVLLCACTIECMVAVACRSSSEKPEVAQPSTVASFSDEIDVTSGPFWSILNEIDITSWNRIAARVERCGIELDGTITAQGSRVWVAGMTAAEIEVFLRLLDLSGHQRNVHVDIVHRQPAYRIEGAVSHAGSQHLNEGTTLGDAIALAVPSEDADLGHAELLRLVVVDGELDVIKLDARDGVVLSDGDCLLVPAKPLPELRDVSPRVRIAAVQR
jgi:hypothetical protein